MFSIGRSGASAIDILISRAPPNRRPASLSPVLGGEGGGVRGGSSVRRSMWKVECSTFSLLPRQNIQHRTPNVEPPLSPGFDKLSLCERTGKRENAVPFTS